MSADLLFSFDGTTFGPLLKTPRALVIYSRGQSYPESSPTPASEFDYQTGYIDFWLKFIGVQEVETLLVDNTWSEKAAASIAGRASKRRRLRRGSDPGLWG